MMKIFLYIFILCSFFIYPMDSSGFKLGLHMDLTYNNNAETRSLAISKANR